MMMMMMMMLMVIMMMMIMQTMITMQKMLVTVSCSGKSSRSKRRPQTCSSACRWMCCWGRATCSFLVAGYYLNLDTIQVLVRDAEVLLLSLVRLLLPPLSLQLVTPTTRAMRQKWSKSIVLLSELEICRGIKWYDSFLPPALILTNINDYYVFW